MFLNIFKYISTLVLTFQTIVAFKNDVYSLNYYYSGNDIEFAVSTNISSNNWWFGIGLSEYKTDKYMDTVIVWKDTSNIINIEAFYLVPAIRINSSEIYNYRKPSSYLKNKTMTIRGTEYFLNFKRQIDTGVSNDNQIFANKNMNITFVRGLVSFPAVHDYLSSQIENMTTAPNNMVVMSQYSINMFYPSIATFFIYFGILLFYIVTQTKHIKIFNKNVNLYIFGYQTTGTLIFCVSYLIWWVGMLTYSCVADNKSALLFRLGVWIMLNASNILLPITRNSIWLYFFKIPYLNIINLHKFMAILCIISVLIKFIYVLVLYPPQFLILLLNTSTGGSPLAGTISTFAFLLLGLFSNPYIRNRNFELFYFTHRTMSLIAIATSIWHYLISIYYIIPSFTLYLVDLIVRLVNIKKGIYFKLKRIGDVKKDTGCVIITIKKNMHINTYPGCYFLLCIRKISSYEWHPFSLIEHRNNKLIFCAKVLKEGSWTDKLRKLSFEKPDNKTKDLHDTDIYFQGPYGLMNIDYNKYQYIVNIAGGSGITSIFSILDHISELMYLNKLPHLRKLVFIWIIPHTSFMTHFNNKIIELNHYITDITVFVTRQETEPGFPSYVKFYKPNICDFIEKYVGENDINHKDIGVVTCASYGLTEIVKKTSNKLDIDVFCEDF